MFIFVASFLLITLLMIGSLTLFSGNPADYFIILHIWSPPFTWYA